MILANCWTWDVDPVILPLWGPVQIRWYGVAFLGVFVGGHYLLRWQTLRAGRSEQVPTDFINYGIVGVLAGAWFGHRLFYDWHEVVRNPLYLIDITKGLAGLSSHGATIGLILSIALFARRQKIPIGEMYDRFSFAAALGSALVRVGNLFNSEIGGTPTDKPWAVCMPRFECDLRHFEYPCGVSPIPRHPSQIYEALMGFAVLGILWLVDRASGGEKRPRWLMAGTFCVVYFTGRFYVEYTKEHQVFTDPSATLDMGQYLSLPFVALGVAFIVYAFTKRLPAAGPLPPREPPTEPRTEGS